VGAVNYNIVGFLMHYESGKKKKNCGDFPAV